VLKKVSRLMIYGAMMPAQAAWGSARHGLALQWFSAGDGQRNMPNFSQIPSAAGARQDAKLHDLQQWGDVN
jgi:hypothetical protein